MNKVSLNEMLDVLRCDILETKGPRDREYMISNIAAPDQINGESLDWVKHTNPHKQAMVEASKARIILCDPEVQYTQTMEMSGKVLIYVKNPKLAVAKVGNHFFAARYEAGYHPSAVIDNEVIIGENTHIGANCTIGKCRIGANCVIHSNAVIYDNVQIGNYVIIHAGAVIGTEGLGCEKAEDGTWIKFPHLGGVIIGDNVEIGANSYVSRGALSDTVIGNGTKINGICFIAHNVVIGENVLITGCVMICGSVRIHDGANVSPGATIREQVTIGEESHIGLGAVVTKNIPANQIWIGNPARYLRDCSR